MDEISNYLHEPRVSKEEYIKEAVLNFIKLLGKK